MELLEHIRVRSHDSMSLFGQTNRGASESEVLLNSTDAERLCSLTLEKLNRC